MQSKSTPKTIPAVAYSSLVGKILAQQREAKGLKQGDLAGVLGLSQSAYSRLESGDSVLNVSQLRNACGHLKIRPSLVLGLADEYESELRRQGVKIILEKPTDPAAIAIGLGLLAALLLNAK